MSLETQLEKTETFKQKQKENRNKIIKFPSENVSGYVAPDIVLANAFGNLSEVIIAGKDKNGKYWISTSMEDVGQILLIIEVLKDTVKSAWPDIEYNMGNEEENER